jgi:hypothetical protein
MVSCLVRDVIFERRLPMLFNRASVSRFPPQSISNDATTELQQAGMGGSDGHPKVWPHYTAIVTRNVTRGIELRQLKWLTPGKIRDERLGF